MTKEGTHIYLSEARAHVYGGQEVSKEKNRKLRRKKSENPGNWKFQNKRDDIFL